MYVPGADIFRKQKKGRYTQGSMSISPTYWGPGYWRTIHSVAFWYPTHPSIEQQTDAARFFNAIGGLLPCMACRLHYAEILRAMPVEDAVSDRMALLKWTIEVHNAVNLSTGAKVLRVDDAILAIERSQSTSSGERPTMRDLPYAGLLVLLGVVLGMALAGTVARRRENAPRKDP